MISLQRADGKRAATPVTVMNYPDGTYKIDLPDDFYSDACCCEQDGVPLLIIWKYGGETELPVFIYVANMLKEVFPKATINLFMPYVPNARMDRVHGPTECFTLKYFCQLINSIGFNSVCVIDAHSNVTPALLSRCVNLSPADYIETALKECNFNADSDLLLFPDEGACKRYIDLFPHAKHVAFGAKKRDWETGKICGVKIDCEEYLSYENRSNRVFIVDDICARGGTVYYTLEELRKSIPDLKANVFFTHCENSIAEGKLLDYDLIETIFTTDSLCTLPTDNNKLRIIPINL